METTLSILIVIVLIASTGANVEDLSENALKGLDERLFIKKPKSDLSARLINPYIRSEIQGFPEVFAGSTFIRSTGSLSGQEDAINDGVCGLLQGIVINEDKTYCNISHLAIRVTKSGKNAKTYIDVIVLVQPPRSVKGKGLFLNLPVFKTPSVNTEQQHGQAWREKIGRSSPIDPEHMRNMRQMRIIPFNTIWLKEVLESGVRDTGIRHAQMDIFVSYPIVLSDYIIDRIIAMAHNQVQNLDNVTEKNRMFPSTFLNGVSQLFS